MNSQKIKKMIGFKCSVKSNGDNMGKIKLESDHNVLYSSWIKTPVGKMLAVANDNFLYMLEFGHRLTGDQEFKKLRKKIKIPVVPGKPKPIQSIEKELTQYFRGKLKTFKTPMLLLGSPFQKRVWNALMKIPFGETCSYADLASAIKKPTAYRAVANANGANALAIIIPCHRVINSNGKIGGYGGGIPRKYWLIEHENKLKNKKS